VLEFFESLSGTHDLPPVFGDDDPDALPKVPALNCHLFVMFHTFANQIFCNYKYIF
jgi:hypothetical protein